MTTAAPVKPYTEAFIGKPGSEEWLEARRKAGIGASESAAVLGLSPWATPLDVYLQKHGLKAVEETRAMRRGNALEPFIQSEFELDKGFHGYKPESMFKSLQHPFLFANLDWLSADGKFAAEFKATDSQKDWGETSSQNVPLHYYIQCQHQLLVTGLDLIYLVALLPYSDLRTYPIEPSPEVQARIVSDCGLFWADTCAGIHPVCDTKPDAVKALYSTVDENTIEITADDAPGLITRHAEIRGLIKDLDAEKDTIEARLLLLTGTASKAKIPGWSGSITRSVTEAKSYTVNRKGGISCRINHPRNKGE